MRTVLIAEDNAVNRELLRELLETRGYTVLEACDGTEGIEKATAERPDRVLLDKLFTGQALLTDPVEQHMSPPLPTIGSTEQATATLLRDIDVIADLIRRTGIKQ